MAFLKPQSPMQKGKDYFYPLTTADQVIFKDGNRLEDVVGKKEIQTITLKQNAWSDKTPYVQSISVDGLSDKINMNIHPHYPEDFENKVAYKEEYSKISNYTRNNNVIVFECWESIPAMDIDIDIEMNIVYPYEIPKNIATKEYIDNEITDRVIYGKGKNLLNINNPTKRDMLISTDGSFVKNSGFMSYRIPSTGGQMTVSFTPQKNFDALRYGSEIDGVITRYSADRGVTVDTSQWDALWISIVPYDDVITNVMVEEGSVATEYEPYYDGLIDLTDRGMDLLWENERPTSEFQPQTITINLTNYNAIRIYCYNSENNAHFLPVVDIPIGKSAYVIGSTVSQMLTRRTVSTTESSITISVCSYNNGSETASNNIPVKIYGIKGVM